MEIAEGVRPMRSAAGRIPPLSATAQGLEYHASVLDSVGRELMSRSKEIGAIVSREEGKPMAEGVGEVYRAGQFFAYYAGEVLRQIGDFVQSVRRGVEFPATHNACSLNSCA